MPTNPPVLTIQSRYLRAFYHHTFSMTRSPKSHRYDGEGPYLPVWVSEARHVHPDWETRSDVDDDFKVEDVQRFYDPGAILQCRPPEGWYEEAPEPGEGDRTHPAQGPSPSLTDEGLAILALEHIEQASALLRQVDRYDGIGVSTAQSRLASAGRYLRTTT